MTFDRLRRRMKAIIWMITIVFVSSVFFLAGGSLCVKQKNEEMYDRQQQEANAEKNKRPKSKDDLPEDSKAVLATVELFGHKAQVTEGELNRRLNQMARFNPSPVVKGMTPKAMKGFFGKPFLDQMVNERLVELAAQEQHVNVDKETKEFQQMLQDPEVQANLKRNDISPAEALEDKIKEARSKKMMETITEGSPVAEEKISYYYDQHKNDEFRDPVTKQPKPLDAALKRQITDILRGIVTDDAIQKYYDEHKQRWRKPEKITVSHLMIDPRSEARSKSVTVTEAEIQDYYKQNKSNFVDNPKVVLRHILIDPKSYAAKAPTDAELQAYYDAHKDDFTKPERVTAQLILLGFPPNAKPEDRKKLEAKAKSLREDLKKGAKFEDLAKANSTDKASAEKGGDIGTVEKSKHSPAFDRAVFALKPGETSEAFQDEDGWQIVKVNKREEKAVQPLAEVKDQVKQKVADQTAEKAAREEAQKIAAALKTTPADFEKVAKDKSAAPSKDKGGLLPELYLGGNKDSKDLEEITTYGYMEKEIQDAITKLKPGQVSDVIEVKDAADRTRLHIVKLEKNLPPGPRPLEDVKGEITDLLREGKVETEALKVSEQIKKRVKDGESFESLIPQLSDGKDKDAKGMLDGLVVSSEAQQTVDAKLLADLAPNGLLPEPIANALGAATDGQVVGPVTYEKKDHYFHVIKHLPAEYKPLDEDMRKEIRFALNPTVTTEEVQAYYKDHTAEFKTPEMATAEWIVLPDKESAQDLLAAVQSDPKKWDEAHPEKHSGEIRNKEIKKVLGSLKANEFTKEPVKISLGWMVARLVKSEAGGELPLSKVEKQVRDRLLNQKKQQLYESWLDELKHQAKIVKQTVASA